MAEDIRAKAAKYYDLNPQMPDDIGFYKARVPSPKATILELGSGTGPILIPLAGICTHIHGVDFSEAMVAICKEKLAKNGIPSSKAQVEVGDITNLNINRKFDLIIAPFRVFQNLEIDTEVDGIFESIRRHLSFEGTCILNVFRPHFEPEPLRRKWYDKSEYFCWESVTDDGRVTCHGRNANIHAERNILFPELIYRYYIGEKLKDEVVLQIAMRCYYPAELERVILDHGFKIIGRWGSYKGERYIEGPELVIQFREAGYRDRGKPHSSPLPHHAAYGSVLRDSADQASSDPGERKSK
jgi:ubiquinone/menaquinone biosynthesis C-methylase UbiE